MSLFSENKIIPKHNITLKKFKREGIVFSYDSTLYYNHRHIIANIVFYSIPIGKKITTFRARQSFSLEFRVRLRLIADWRFVVYDKDLLSSTISKSSY